ncbi:MAG: hypothetical protein AAFY56_12830, partial [Pseudomonadota bacterium]
RANLHDMSDPFWCKAWTECDSGRALELCLHEGGHGVPQGWSDKALLWFEGLNERPPVANAARRGND